MAATPEWVSGGGRRGEHQRSLGGGGQRLRSGNAGKKAAGHAGTAEPRWKGGERRASLRHWHSRGSGEGVLTCGEKREPDLGWETEGANETACAQEGCCHDGRARQTLVRQLQGWGRGAHASSSLHSMSLTRSRRAVALPPPAAFAGGATAVQNLPQMAQLVQGRVGIPTPICLATKPTLCPLCQESPSCPLIPTLMINKVHALRGRAAVSAGQERVARWEG